MHKCFKSFGIIALMMITSISSQAVETKKPNKLQIVPQGLVGIKFSVPKNIKAQDISYQKAKKIKKQTNKQYEKHYKDPNHRRWFFHAFDNDNLIFWIAKFTRNPKRGKQPYGTYIVENIYQVKRSKNAEKSLNTKNIIQLYEIGKKGIKGGMTKKEVINILGKPTHIRELGPFGSFDFIYDNLTIRFLDDKVAHVN